MRNEGTSSSSLPSLSVAIGFFLALHHFLNAAAPKTTPLKTNMTLENHHFLVGNTSSNGGCSIVMIVFGGGGVTLADCSLPVK